ncbi:hypothetical protein ACIGN6_15740 [Streptomyces sp. NPDC053792]|uniref:hypothetical protein n=1 Tax=Streptomyces sp. NPDC053792 TaxID=3365716 RepID=UPI0037D518CE
MSVPDSPPGTRRRSALRRTLATLAALVLPGLGPSAPSPAYADGAGARDIRTVPPGTALAWGSNDSGRLGDGSTSDPGRATTRRRSPRR